MNGGTRHFKGISVTPMPFHLYFPNEESVSWMAIEISDPAHRSVIFPLLLVEFHTDPFSSRKYGCPDEFDLHQALSIEYGAISQIEESSKERGNLLLYVLLRNHSVGLRASPVGSAVTNF